MKTQQPPNKSKRLRLIILIAACCAAFVPAFAEDPQYNVVNLDTLGGTNHRGNAINDRGWVAGYSNLPGDTARHAALWRNGTTIEDLGTLGGPNSSVTWNSK